MIFDFLMIRRPTRSTLSSSSAASEVYKIQSQSNYAAYRSTEGYEPQEGTQAYIDKYGQTESTNETTINPNNLQNTQEDVTPPNQTIDDMLKRNIDTGKTEVKTGVRSSWSLKGSCSQEQKHNKSLA